jgi:hypothetical protein
MPNEWLDVRDVHVAAQVNAATAAIVLARDQ